MAGKQQQRRPGTSVPSPKRQAELEATYESLQSEIVTPCTAKRDYNNG